MELASWIAPAATMIAAIMTAANLGSRVTGWGFAVFSVGAIAWIIVAAGTGQQNLLISNAFLLLVDLVGVWRWLGRKAHYDSGAEEARRQSADAATPALFPLGTLEGMAVRDADGGPIATVVDAMASCARGQVAYLVVRVGGIAGVGERLHALRWDEVSLGQDGFVSRLSADALAARKVLPPGEWPASAELALRA